MTAKDKFNHHLLHYLTGVSFPMNYPAVVVAGGPDYDCLFQEVTTSLAELRIFQELTTSIAESRSCEQSPVSLEFQRKSVAHFYYRGILVIRSPGLLEGFFFA